MAVTLVDYVKIQTLTLGPGTLTLGDPVTGFRGTEALVDGSTYSYSLSQPTGEWEVGRGVYTDSVKSLSRSPLFSSSSGSAIPLTGLAQVTITILAEDIAALTVQGISIAGTSQDLNAVSITASVGYNGIANVFGAPITIHMPASPADGDVVVLSDEAAQSANPSARGCGTHSWTVVSGLTTLSDMTVDGSMFKARFSAARSAWVPTL